MSDAPSTPASEPTPQAAMKPIRRRFLGWFWILPGAVLVIVTVVVFLSLSRRGERIYVFFDEGHGLKPGDALLCRGISVGEVRSVELSSDLNGVDVVIDLRLTAAGIAVEGSRFWIVRPQVALTGLSGLDTVVGAKYVAVRPGSGAVERKFVGEETPVLERVPGGLEIVVQDRRMGGLRPRTADLSRSAHRQRAVSRAGQRCHRRGRSRLGAARLQGSGSRGVRVLERQRLQGGRQLIYRPPGPGLRVRRDHAGRWHGAGHADDTRKARA